MILELIRIRASARAAIVCLSQIDSRPAPERDADEATVPGSGFSGGRGPLAIIPRRDSEDRNRSI